MIRKIFTCAALCALVAVTSAARAQVAGYPAQPVRMIATFPPGGSVDVVARILGPKLSESLGQPVLVENRSGAGGNIGTEQAARARPDGHTLLIHTIPLVANAFLYSRMPYDALADFVPVTWLSYVGLDMSLAFERRIRHRAALCRFERTSANTRSDTLAP